MVHLHLMSLLAPLLYLFLHLFVQSATSSICTSSSTSSLDFGSCSNPGITYGYGLDGSSQYGFAPANQSQFPHAFSPDVADVESYICARLKDVCQASSAAVQACKSAFWRYSGLAGQNAVDAWNTALGVSSGSRPSSIGSGSGNATQCTVTTTTTTELVTSPPSSLVSISLFITITSTVVSASSPPTSSLAVTASTSTTRSTRTEVQTATVFVPSGPSTPASTSSSSSITTTTPLTTAIASQSSSKPAVDTNGSPFQDSARSLRLDRTNLALSLAILLAFVTC